MLRYSGIILGSILISSIPASAMPLFPWGHRRLHRMAILWTELVDRLEGRHGL